MPDSKILRSFLFAPGSDERKLRKAAASEADAVVFDLEDSVPPELKEEARRAVAGVLEELGRQESTEMHVRVNRSRDGYDEADLGEVVRPGVSAIRLPKCENASEIRRVAAYLDELESKAGIPAGAVSIYPTIESATGVKAAEEIMAVASRVRATVFGPADFAASVGLWEPAYEATLLARSTVVLESAAAGLGPPVDGAFLAVRDLDGLREESRRARALGFGGKSAIHPGQVPIINEVFTPTEDELERAQRVVSSLDDSATGIADGHYYDPPVVARARAVLRFARQIESGEQIDG